MNELANRIIEVLHASFPDGVIDISEQRPLVVRLIADEFDDQDDVDRQTRVWGLLREKLEEGELHLVEYVFTLTKAEAAEDEASAAV